MASADCANYCDLDDFLLEGICASVTCCSAMDLFPNLIGVEDAGGLDTDFTFLDAADCEEIIVSEHDEDSSSGESHSEISGKWVAQDGSSPQPPSSAPARQSKREGARSSSGSSCGGGSSNKRDKSGGGDGLSKNAIAARENRIKKKKYMEGLEEEVKVLTVENNGLRSRTEVLEGTVDTLQAEVEYLRGVLENVDEISALLKSVRSTSGLKVACNVKQQIQGTATKRKSEGIETTSPSKRRSVVVEHCKTKNSGVCFHVNAGQVSLEFCPQCSANAAISSG